MSKAGFYIAQHPWLEAEGLHKVGCTKALGRRLGDGAYTTCFPPGWAYRATFETATERDAQRLEAGVLYCTEDRRVPYGESKAGLSELVREGLPALVDLAEEVAAALGVAAARRSPPPEYPAPAAPRQRPTAKAAGGAALLEAADKERLANVLRDSSRLVARRPSFGARGSFEDARSSNEPRASPNEHQRASEDDRGGASDGETFADELLLEEGERQARRPPLEERPYQAAAIAAVEKELGDPANGGRAILQMACRCGKTRVAHGVIRGACARGARRVLYLVPGLALLRQTAEKLDHYGLGDEGRLLLVGSDGRGVALAQGEARATTDAAEIARAVEFLDPRGSSLVRRCSSEDARSKMLVRRCSFEDARSSNEPRAASLEEFEATSAAHPSRLSEDWPGGPGHAKQETSAFLVVIATYQSSPLLPDAFDLTVFDESHRTCGARAPRPFNHVLLRHARGARLYMTATPRYDAALSMKDRALYGGVAYAYHLREGVDAGYVNAFGLELVGRPAAAGEAKAAAATATAAQVAAALGRLGAAGKLLVFCRSIRHAAALRAETEALVGAGACSCLCAHSRMAPAAVAAALARFRAPGRPAALFNCRLFQEGVEIPELTGVFFAAPRHSPRDIIQSLCRPLNALPGKPPSTIFLPAAYGAGEEGEGGAAALERFAGIVPYFDALVAEDPLLYEHLLDPRGTPYALGWVDSAGGGGRYRPEELLAAARGAVRRTAAGGERLLRAAKIPWEIGFAELRRVVAACGRYPKTTDTYEYAPGARVNFGQFYRYAREAYAKWRAGAPSPLEPHQLRALEGLPKWEPYGLEGPYPWAEALAFLEEWLAAHGGAPPMVEINKGGYVGLEATPLERLSGALTCVNQADGRDRKNGGAGSGFTLDAAKQADLDALCAKWGLRWRKERRPPPPGAPPGAVGSLVEDGKGAYAGPPTFIQEAYGRFKAEWRARGAASPFVAEWFPGYPLKHSRQERADVWARRKEIVPPRWRKRAAARPGRPRPPKK